MVDMSAIAGALAALKGANDIAQAMIGLRDAAAFQTKLIEFQAKIIEANNSAFAAQDERAALLQKIGDLEKEMAALKAERRKFDRYKLKEMEVVLTLMN
jgi:septal ring factor EnvC (AmiA/AmiB activator)